MASPAPALFDRAKAEGILQCVLSGASLADICGANGFPPRSLVAHWLAEDPEFRARYLKAREIGAEMLADDLLKWANAGLVPDLRITDRVGHAPSLSELTQAHRTRIAVKQWLMAKWAPDKYAGRTAERAERSSDEPPERQALPAPLPTQPAIPRISPRAFTIPPIAAIAPITVAGLAMPRIAATADPDPEHGEDAASEPVRSATPAPPRSRHQRRAMAAIARRRRPDLAQNSRAPPA